MKYRVKSYVFDSNKYDSCELDDSINELLDKNTDAHILSITECVIDGDSITTVYFEYVNEWKD